LAKELVDEDSSNEVILLVANNRVDDSVRSRISPTVRFICLGRPPGSRNPYWMIRLLFSLYRLEPTVVHAHSDNLAKLSRFISVPIILTVHANHIELAAAAASFAMVCCISESVLKDVRSRYPSLNACLVTNGIVTSEIATDKRKPCVSVRGVQVGRLVHEIKGQDLLIKALAIVNVVAEQPKLIIDFVGDGPSLVHLTNVATEAGVSDFCHFNGSISRTDVYQRLCTYDLLIQPSRSEGFGLTVAEGMAAGVAVVVSDIEGPMEIIANGEFGIFFKSNDVASLATALQKAIFSLNTPAGNALLVAARKHVLKNYDIHRTSAHYCQIYREIIYA
jgi:glycosyltransferase involved in cell wall biosynthesis